MVIGLEVHVELSTRTKMFCSCPADFGGEPNTHVCPVCLALPGALPVPNRRAVEFAIRAARALHCEIAAETKFDRKNYHYPDLPKGYQISQYDQPLARNGWLEIETEEGRRRIRIRRLHMEEDAGKSLHGEGDGEATLLDFNRAGVPLVEIVSEPDLRSPEEARAYLEMLRATVFYTGVSDVKMEEGSLRCDANVSIRPRGSSELGVLVEVKNMNSFRAVQRALAYEAERQARALARGERLERETRHWDEARGVTLPGRSKEEVNDYRYFPEPDLVPLRIDPAWVAEIEASLPELPEARLGRYQEAGLAYKEAWTLVAQRELGDFLDATVAAGAPLRQAANWLLGEVSARLNESGRPLAELRLTPAGLAGLVALVEAGTVTPTLAKQVFARMLETGEEPAVIVEREGLVQIRDEAALEAVAERVIEANPKVVADILSGKEKAVAALVGQVMRETRGKANAAKVNEVLRRRLAELRQAEPRG
ncbi:MAG: Asp-tRNA(Asn)/Glu-tRNA(Gln) amidotransferase subunit GatB [Clostridia bacterium]|nr:Asp-tRNA(Asn)/Glu-tRNA(Gln) amidotransferase subunit GatB [Clostridia bacterium]MCL6522331.1 Asp-tRNA(Asn)/Glu-tRNA(Gln) amidotransferase subunit GatB [Bacillota bacterium]